MRKKERTGKAEVPEWWWEVADPLLDRATNAELAARASEIAGRRSAWDASSISKFRSRQVVTRELCNALSQHLGIPRPFFTAASQAEAVAIESVLGAIQAASSGAAEISARRADEVSQVLEQAVEQAKDQTKPVRSADEGKDRGRGARRPPPRR